MGMNRRRCDTLKKCSSGGGGAFVLGKTVFSVTTVLFQDDGASCFCPVGHRIKK